MAVRVAINGYGRIGRNILRACYESGNKDIKIVAINDLGDAKTNAHLTKYDTAHGKFNAVVSLAADGTSITVNGDEILICAEKNPANLPWAKLGIDIVFECTGIFASKAACQSHLDAGASKVLISAPASGVDRTVVFGVNQHELQPSDTVISNASCTTNCLAPLAKVLLDANITIENGVMTTIHAYTNDQVLTDVYHTDLRRARSATQSMIPTKTGAAKAVALVLPELEGKFEGFAIRVPTINVSLVDLSFVATGKISADEINQHLQIAAKKPEWQTILDYVDAPLVSVDFNHSSFSSNFDATLTQTLYSVATDTTLIKVCSWYDNEWGFSNRMLDTAQAFHNA